MVACSTRHAVSDTLLSTLARPMVPCPTSAAYVYLFVNNALRSDVVPTLALETLYWLLLALSDRYSLVAYC